MNLAKTIYLLVLFVAFVAISILLAFHPVHRLTWWSENITIWIVLAAVVYLGCRGVVLSSLAYSIIFAGCVSHIVGGFYTFQLVPLGDMVSQMAGWERNHYDHFGHFLCGCFAFPMLEIIRRKIKNLSLMISSVFAFALMMSVAALYEIWEWLTIYITEQQTHLTYVGAQGDEWDAQMDMLACMLGAIFSLLLYRLVCSKNVKLTSE